MRSQLPRRLLASISCLSVAVALWAVPATAQVTLSLADAVSFEDEVLPLYESPSDYAGSRASCQDCWSDSYTGYGCNVRPSRCAPLGWARAEYLWWRTKGNDIPALVATGTTTTPEASALFGTEQIDNDFRSGLRINLGRWLDECQQMGLEVVYFSVFDDHATGDFFAATTGGAASGEPILVRPFYNVFTDDNDHLRISFPGETDGSINIQSSSELHSVSVLLRKAYHRGPRGRVDLIGGYRYFRFREGLQIDQRSVLTNPNNPGVGNQFELFDRFLAENDFHGGDLGFVAEFSAGPAALEILAKVALGNLHRTVTIDGSTEIRTPPPTTVSGGTGGLLALVTNTGQKTDNDFAALPEFGLNARYQVTNCLTLVGGYTLVMLNDVVRTGEQIDRGVNPSYFPGNVPVGEPRPQRLDNNVTDLWVHGLSVGAQMVW